MHFLSVRSVRFTYHEKLNWFLIHFSFRGQEWLVRVESKLTFKKSETPTRAVKLNLLTHQ